MDAPVDGLETFVDVSLVQKIDEGAGDDGLVLRRHGQIRVLPAAENAEADEIFALQVYVLFCVFTAGGADLRGGHAGFFRT